MERLDAPERRGPTQKANDMKQTLKTIAVLALFAAIGVILAWRG